RGRRAGRAGTQPRRDARLHQDGPRAARGGGGAGRGRGRIERGILDNTMKRTDFRFLERLRVRWAEIDAQKIVFNGHYLMYFDTALGGYWRALATPYAETMARLEGDLFVRKATVEYEASARYDDVLDIGLRCARVGNSSV